MDAIRAAAQYNTRLQKTEEPIEIYVILPYFLDIFIISLYANDIIKAVNNANLHFPGTVTHIIRELPHYFHRNEIFLSRITNQISYRSPIKFGVKTKDMIVFQEQANRILLPPLDIIFFESYPSHIDVDKPVHDSFISVTETFKNANFSVMENVTWAGTKKVGLMSSFPDTSESGYVSYYKLVQFWKAVNEWAGYKNVMVIMKSAFDLPYGYPGLTLGWWRIEVNGSYRFPSDFVFQEKASLISTDESHWTTNPYKEAIFLNPDKNCKFSESNALIWMPRTWYDRTSGRKLSVNGKQIATVVKKFRKISVDSFNDTIAGSLAISNRNRQMNESPVKVLYFHHKGSIEDTLHKVSKINLIYPGTLNAIIITNPMDLTKLRILKAQIRVGFKVNLSECKEITYKGEK